MVIVWHVGSRHLATTEFMRNSVGVSPPRREAWLVPKEQTDRFAVKRCDARIWLTSGYDEGRWLLDQWCPGTASTSANADQNPRGQPKIVVERIVDGSHVIAGHTGLLGIGTYR